LAFTIPFIVRAIPEILMGPYIVGFDTLGYYVPNTLSYLRSGINPWAFIADAPFIYLPLLGLTSIGASIVVTLKVLAPLLLGFLGLSVYFYAKKTLLWSNRKSLIVVFFATLYFVALRISWDMLRSELGLIFLFTMLIFLKSGRPLRNGVLLFVSMVMVVFSNQLVAVIMFAIVLAAILRFYVDKKKFELRRLAVCFVVVAFLFLVTLYATSTLLNFSLIGSFPNKGSGEDFALLGFSSYGDLVSNTMLFLVFCYLPLLPLLIIGARYFKSNIQLKAWIAWVALALLFAIISPNASFAIYPYRWILLLTYPLAFYAVDAFSHVKRKLSRIGMATGMGLILITLSASFIALPNTETISYYGLFTAYVPKSMLQNTVKLSDCQDTVNAIQWAKNNIPSNGSLIVHDVFWGWASLTIETNKLTHCWFYDPETTAQQMIENGFSNSLFLIWWVNGTGWYGKPTVSSASKEVYHSGEIAIYQYMP
jgi:hypothetical protein